MDYTLTLVATPITPLQEAHFEQAIQILRFKVAEPTWLDKAIAANMAIPKAITIEQAHNLRKNFDSQKIDMFCTPSINRRKKLLVADMDATIVTTETLDELADEMGLKDKISAITERAMRGELDFFNALRERVSLLKGLPEEALKRTLDNTEISQGAKTLIQTMRQHNNSCVLVSGGFTYFTKNIAMQLGFNNHHGNILELQDGLLTGKVIDPILDKETKLKFLKEYAEKLNIGLNETIAIGDGANDLPMLEAAGLGIGYHPKPLVEERLINCIRHTDLTSALYVQGYKKQEFVP